VRFSRTEKKPNYTEYGISAFIAEACTDP